MNYSRLRELQNELMQKKNKTVEENELLQEISSLFYSLDIGKFSLSLSDGVCHTCGRSFEK